MSKTVEVKTSGRTFKVNLPDIQKETEWLKKQKIDVMSGETEYNVIYTEDIADVDEAVADLDKMQHALSAIEADPSVLSPHIDQIRKKKNGGFWKQSGTDVLLAENCTEYFTDFTNAWSALVLRLDVVDEQTCTLSLRERTFTH